MCLTVDIVKQGPVNSLFRLVLLYCTYINTARLASQYRRAPPSLFLVHPLSNIFLLLNHFPYFVLFHTIPVPISHSAGGLGRGGIWEWELRGGNDTLNCCVFSIWHLLLYRLTEHTLSVL